VVYNFTLIIGGTQEISDAIADQLYEAGCDDCTPGQHAGAPYVVFDRESTSIEHAVTSAIKAVNKVGLDVVHVEPDDLVSQSEIARRLNRSRESVRKLIGGERQAGGFPAPIAHVTTDSPLWSWATVTKWGLQHKICDASTAHDAEKIRAINAQLGHGHKKVRTKSSRL
jgi:hypothetical protein